MSGSEKFRKWDHSHGSAPGDYDSTMATDANINSMLIRIGVGLTEYIHLGHGKWWFTITEDGGFLGNSLSKTGDADITTPSRTRVQPK